VQALPIPAAIFKFPDVDGRSHAAAASPRMDGVILRLERTLCSLSLLFLVFGMFVIVRTY